MSTSHINSHAAHARMQIEREQEEGKGEGRDERKGRGGGVTMPIKWKKMIEDLRPLM